MNRTEQTNTYVAPDIKVVAFKIEQGFTGSNLRAEPTTTSETGTEEVTEGNSLGDYFPRGN